MLLWNGRKVRRRGRITRPQPSAFSRLFSSSIHISTILTEAHQGPILTMGGVERPGGILCYRGSSAADGVQAQLDWEA
jgi:hypothetical protein